MGLTGDQLSAPGQSDNPSGGPGERSGYENRKLSDGCHELWVLLVSEKFAVSASLLQSMS